MSIDADRLANLTAEITRLETLQPELERQRKECQQVEEMVKSLRWEAYQAEQAYRQVEADEGSVFAWLGGLFGGNRPDKEELFRAALEARESYETAREKFKPLKQELEALETELRRLPDLKAEQAALLDQQTKALLAHGGGTSAAGEELIQQVSLVRSLLNDLADIRKLGVQAESALSRCDNDSLFSTRQTMKTFQNAVIKLLERMVDVPAQWLLPSLIPINEVRLLDPVGTGVGFRPPDMSDVPLSLQGTILGLRAREEAVRAAVRAADEAIREQASYQVILVRHWLTRLKALEERLNELVKELEKTQLSAVLGTTGSSAALGVEASVDSCSVPATDGNPVLMPETAVKSLPAGAEPATPACDPGLDLRGALQRVADLAYQAALSRTEDFEKILSIHLVVQRGDDQKVDFHLERLDESVQYLFPSQELTAAIRETNEVGLALDDQWRGFELILLPSGEAHTRLL
jgi:DNA repair exonuclease SbcCD ATPase subunit